MIIQLLSSWCTNIQKLNKRTISQTCSPDPWRPSPPSSSKQNRDQAHVHFSMFFRTSLSWDLESVETSSGLILDALSQQNTLDLLTKPAIQTEMDSEHRRKSHAQLLVLLLVIYSKYLLVHRCCRNHLHSPYLRLRLEVNWVYLQSLKMKLSSLRCLIDGSTFRFMIQI